MAKVIGYILPVNDCSVKICYHLEEAGVNYVSISSSNSIEFEYCPSCAVIPPKAYIVLPIIQLEWFYRASVRSGKLSHKFFSESYRSTVAIDFKLKFA